MRLARFEGDAQRHALAQQVLLAHHLGQRARAQDGLEVHRRPDGDARFQVGHLADRTHHCTLRSRAVMVSVRMAAPSTW